MVKQDKLACSVCGAYSRSPSALCAPRPASSLCPGAGAVAGGPVPTEQGAAAAGPGATERRSAAGPETPTQPPRVRSRHPSLEMLFCAPVGYEARYSCSHCGRLATAPDLLCLPKERGGT